MALFVLSCGGRHMDKKEIKKLKNELLKIIELDDDSNVTATGLENAIKANELIKEDVLNHQENLNNNNNQTDAANNNLFFVLRRHHQK